ncbi:MAG: OsmC family peroxiredoxin [Verrucomicrobia bacterium]|nr:OsmC family peroxiredoxin [Verrucomicrobiota bacterium]
MVKIRVRYEGQLHCTAVHGPSGRKLETDAPVDNEGKGESFSPTDLVATALAACMATIMGIVAKRHSISLEGMEVVTTKEMSADTPRRIVALKSTITMPLPENHPQRKLLEKMKVSGWKGPTSPRGASQPSRYGRGNSIWAEEVQTPQGKS